MTRRVGDADDGPSVEFHTGIDDMRHSQTEMSDVSDDAKNELYSNDKQSVSILLLFVMPPPNVYMAGGVMVLSCSSVSACVFASQNIVNTISYRVFDTFSPSLHQRCVMGQR